MEKNIQEQAKRAGLLPGILVNVDKDDILEPPRITIMDYNEFYYVEREVGNIEETFEHKTTGAVKWISIESIKDIKTLERIGNRFGIHPLVLEDILNTDQRPKIEDFVDYIYITMKKNYTEDSDESIYIEQFSLIVGNGFVITFQEKEGDIFEPVRDRIRMATGRIRKMGADYLAYALMDIVVDNYFIVLEKLVEKLDDVEGKLDRTAKTENLWEIYELRKEIIVIRKNIWPLRDVINMMIKTESELINEGTKIYLKDVYDHTVQVLDSIEVFREMLSEMLNVYLSITSNKMNEIMKVLTIISTIFIPLTFIAGVYGMNFEFMPELKWKFGYPLVLLVMFSIGASFFGFFRIKKWLQ